MVGYRPYMYSLQLKFKSCVIEANTDCSVPKSICWKTMKISSFALCEALDPLKAMKAHNQIYCYTTVSVLVRSEAAPQDEIELRESHITHGSILCSN